MSALLATTLLLLLLSGGAQSETTKMLVLDSGSGKAYRVELGADLSSPEVTEYNIPALAGFRNVDWDYIDDRLFILKGDYVTIQSVFLNGTDLRTVTTLPVDSYAIAVAPAERKVFASILGLRGRNATLVSMDMDGSNSVEIRQARFEAPDMGIDHVKKYLYWTEYLCSCLYRVKYDRENARVQKKFEHIYVKQNPRAVDFRRKRLYGDARDGLYKINLRKEKEKLIYAYNSVYSDETVYDPKTKRIFIYNNENSPNVTVVTSRGRLLGTLQGLSLTAEKRKAIRINPL